MPSVGDDGANPAALSKDGAKLGIPGAVAVETTRSNSGHPASDVSSAAQQAAGMPPGSSSGSSRKVHRASTLQATRQSIMDNLH